MKISIEIDTSKQNEQIGDEVSHELLQHTLRIMELQAKYYKIKAQRNEKKASQTPSLRDMGAEYRFKPLTAFIPPSEGAKKRGRPAGVPNSKYEATANNYKTGRKIHTCFRCGAPHRHHNPAKGGCVECRGLADWEIKGKGAWDSWFK